MFSSEEVIEDLLKSLGIFDLYSQEFRHYHNVQHIADLFTIAEEMDIVLDEAQRHAILFHDAHYLPGGADNESISAAMAMSVLTSTGEYSQDHIVQVGYLIGLTRNHVAPCLQGQVICDLDMAGLGYPENKYRRYSSNVVKEVLAFFPEQVDLTYLGQLLEMRQRWLMTQLQKINIFCLEDFRERFEEQARKNLLTELRAIQELSPQPLPGQSQPSKQQVEDCIRNIFSDIYNIDISVYIGDRNSSIIL